MTSAFKNSKGNADALGLRRFPALRFVSPQTDLALLILRVWMGTALFLRHGLEKVFALPDTISHFPDPLHLGSHVSFSVATISDLVCSILVVLGFLTRCSALLICSNIFVVWALIVHFQFIAHGVSPGEAIVLYLGGFLTIALAGPGRFSLDSVLAKKCVTKS